MHLVRFDPTNIAGQHTDATVVFGFNINDVQAACEPVAMIVLMELDRGVRANHSGAAFLPATNVRHSGTHSRGN